MAQFNAPQAPVLSTEEHEAARRARFKKLKIVLLAAAVIAIAINGVLLVLSPGTFLRLVVPSRPLPSTGASFILSLGTPVKTEQGIVYTGLVQYGADDGSYRFVAPPSEDLAPSFGTASFADNSPNMLAIERNGTSTALIAYDWKKYETVKTIERLASGSLTSNAILAPDGTHYAYLYTDGSSTPIIKVGDTGSSTAHTLKPGFPVGFSPDATKLLLSSGPSFVISTVATDARTEVSGLNLTGNKSRFLLSPSGSLLVSVTDQSVGWYSFDWDTATLRPIGSFPVKDLEDVVFFGNDKLLVRSKGSAVGTIYTIENGAFGSISAVSLPIPEDARILQFTMP